MGVVAPTVLAVEALGAATVEPGAGLAGGGGTSRAGRSSHARIIGNSCAKLDTPQRVSEILAGKNNLNPLRVRNPSRLVPRLPPLLGKGYTD